MSTVHANYASRNRDIEYYIHYILFPQPKIEHTDIYEYRI